MQEQARYYIDEAMLRRLRACEGRRDDFAKLAGRQPHVPVTAASVQHAVNGFNLNPAWVVGRIISMARFTSEEAERARSLAYRINDVYYSRYGAVGVKLTRAKAQQIAKLFNEFGDLYQQIKAEGRGVPA